MTGAGGGIGAAIARALAAAGARVLVTDIDPAAAERVATGIGSGSALATACDAADEGSLRAALQLAEHELGPVDAFFANAGVAPASGLGEEPEWETALQLHLMGHVRAARLLLPGWLARGRGHFVATASAAGLLTQIGSAPYSASKHAALGFAEWLAITHGDRGIGVTCVCPMGVRTAMLEESRPDDPALLSVTAAGAVLEPDEVARQTLDAVAAGRFLVLPHPEVGEFFRRKADDHERWLRGMRRLQDRVGGPVPD